jgi:hypothetical protein
MLCALLQYVYVETVVELLRRRWIYTCKLTPLFNDGTLSSGTWPCLRLRHISIYECDSSLDAGWNVVLHLARNVSAAPV